MERSFSIPTIRNKEDLKKIKSKAQDRASWRNIVVCRVAEAEAT